MGVICPCLPSFRLLLRQLMPSLMGSSGRYEMDPVSNPTIGKSLGGGRDPESGRITVESTVAVKFGNNDSVDWLVEGSASSTEADESGRRKR